MPKFCEYCGTPLKEGARFCVGCGHPVAQPAQPTQQPFNQEPFNQNMNGPRTYGQQAPNVNPTPVQNPYPQTPKKKDNKLLIILLAIAAVLLVVTVIKSSNARKKQYRYYYGQEMIQSNPSQIDSNTIAYC